MMELVILDIDGTTFEESRDVGADYIYIYGLIDPATNGVRYIGKTNHLHRRFIEHLNRCDTGRHYVNRWIKQVRADGGLPLMKILERATLATWQEREIWWIEHGISSNWDLTNLSQGGYGATGYTEEMRKQIALRVKEYHQQHPEARIKVAEKTRGQKRSMATRAKQSAAASGENHHQYGKPVPEEVKQKIVASTSGEKNHFFGRTHSEESKRLISEKKKGVPSPSRRKRVRIGETIYESVNAAAEAFGIHPSSMTERLRSKSGKFKDYAYVANDEQ